MTSTPTRSKLILLTQLRKVKTREFLLSCLFVPVGGVVTDISIVLLFSLNFPCLVLLCLLLLLHDEGEGLDLGDGEVECPDGGVGRVVSVSFVPWVCGGRYRPVLCSVSPPDYLSLLTSLHPSEDRDKVEIWSFQNYIFRPDYIWGLYQWIS